MHELPLLRDLEFKEEDLNFIRVITNMEENREIDYITKHIDCRLKKILLV